MMKSGYRGIVKVIRCGATGAGVTAGRGAGVDDDSGFLAGAGATADAVFNADFASATEIARTFSDFSAGSGATGQPP